MRSLEETLIDFQELIGKHSGENMAESVWDTLTTYNLTNKVCTHIPVLLMFLTGEAGNGLHDGQR